MTHVGMHEAKTKLSQLVVAAEAGEEVVIERRGKAVARLVAIEKPKRSRAELCGSMPGIWMVESLEEFNELPDDIAEAFCMR